ncbi:MAG: hypothetical protein MI922_29045, partial [Bacteroidales bacterium]|nr:hypothetical protein [Bacteroidales bacterium]
MEITITYTIKKNKDKYTYYFPDEISEVLGVDSSQLKKADNFLNILHCDDRNDYQEYITNLD